KPGEPRSLVPLYTQNRREPLNYIMEDTEDFEKRVPTWLPNRKFSDIVSIEDRLYIQYFSMEEYDAGDLIIVAAVPIEKEFLNKLKEYQRAGISLANKEGNRFFMTDSPGGDWYWRLLLKPMASVWDLQALNWKTGYYEHYGRITFEIEPAEIVRTMTLAG